MGTSDASTLRRYRSTFPLRQQRLRRKLVLYSRSWILVLQHDDACTPHADDTGPCFSSLTVAKPGRPRDDFDSARTAQQRQPPRASPLPHDGSRPVISSLRPSVYQLRGTLSPERHLRSDVILATTAEPGHVTEGCRTDRESGGWRCRSKASEDRRPCASER